ncbi:TetR/AcrR family transcriptional regulator [Bacillus manliponensis]|uniref:TetR/AcrR family transcriptional regulator n=1 Tax=Bacillus manliponensis TaxID=574376 RepID=UPI00068F8712|nr:TetR/AcrR family transcriptional regulator [Bacillus manliponensis]
MKVQGIRNTNTKKDIEEAFTYLLRKKDIENITIKNITEKANINRATFYAHFEDKYHLFDEMILKAIKGAINEKAGNLTILDKNHIKVLFTSIYDFMNEIVENCPYSFFKLFPLLRVKMIDVLQVHIQTKLTILEQDIDMFKSLMFSSMLYEAAEISILKKSNLEKDKILDELTNLILK